MTQDTLLIDYQESITYQEFYSTMHLTVATQQTFFYKLPVAIKYKTTCFQ